MNEVSETKLDKLLTQIKKDIKKASKKDVYIKGKIRARAGVIATAKGSEEIQKLIKSIDGLVEGLIILKIQLKRYFGSD